MHSIPLLSVFRGFVFDKSFSEKEEKQVNFSQEHTCWTSHPLHIPWHICTTAHRIQYHWISQDYSPDRLLSYHRRKFQLLHHSEDRFLSPGLVISDWIHPDMYVSYQRSDGDFYSLCVVEKNILNFSQNLCEREIVWKPGTSFTLYRTRNYFWWFPK